MTNVNVYPFAEQAQKFVAPVVKANQQAVANLEKLVGFYQNILPGYVDLGVARLKAAAEVADVKDLQGFYNGQVEAARTLNEKLVADSKALAELVNGFASDYQKLARDSVAELSPKAPQKAA